MDPRSWVVRSKPGLWLTALASVGAVGSVAADAALAVPVAVAALVGAVGLEGWRWRLGRMGLRASPHVATWSDWSGSWAGVQVALGLGRACRISELQVQWKLGERAVPAKVDYAPDGDFLGIGSLIVAHDPLLVPPGAQLVVTLQVLEGDKVYALARTWSPDDRKQGRFATWLVKGRKGPVVDWQRFGRVQESG